MVVNTRARTRAYLARTRRAHRCTEYILVSNGRRVKLNTDTHRTHKRTCCACVVPSGLTVGAVPAAFVDVHVDRQTDTKHPHPARPPAHHPRAHPRVTCTHNAPTLYTHNTPPPRLPTHPPTMHLLAPSHVDVTHGIRHRVRGRCARHTRTYHTSHTRRFRNGPRAEALFSAAPPQKKMDTSSMTAHKAWSPFVDAVMMRWFSRISSTA